MEISWGAPVLCRWLFLLGCLRLLGACQQGGRSIDVVLSGLTDRVRSLQFHATIDGRELGLREHGAAAAFQLLLPSDATGALRLVVVGLGSNGCQLSRGEQTLTLRRDDPHPALFVELIESEEVRGCQVRVRLGGGGLGRVTSMPAGILCETGAASGCSLHFDQVAGAEVTLKADASPGAASPEGSYFAGWTGACSGLGACTVRIGNEPVEVDAGFLQRHVCHSGWCWENPLPQADALFGVGGTSEQDVWFVGAAGTILHWNGMYLAPAPSGTDAGLQGVWARAPNDAWAVGDSGTILRYDGLSWQKVQSGTSDKLWGVWGSGPNDVFVVGHVADQYDHYLEGVILHFDGHSFSTLSRGATAGFQRIWGSGPSDVWAVGTGAQGGVVLHWDGSAFRSVPISARTVNGVWGSGPGDVWVSASDRVDGDALGILLHWDGASFVRVFERRNVRLFDVTGTGPKDVQVVGEDGSGGDPLAVAVRWDGARASVFTTNESRLFGAFASSGQTWAVGGAGLILRSDGVFWSKQNGGLVLPDLSGVGGSGDTIFATSDTGGLVRRTGGSWELVPGISVGQQAHIWASGPGDLWFVGGDTGVRWDGAGAPTGGVAGSDVFGTGPSDVWFVGPNGSVRRWNGTAYVQPASGTTQHLKGVWGSGPRDVWAVGDAGTILHWDGQKLSSIASPVSDDLLAVRGSGPQDVWILGYKGEQGCILHWDGAVWTERLRQDPLYLSRLWVRSPTEAWAVGTTIMRWDGETWTPQLASSSTSLVLYDIWGNGQGDIWAAGENGSLLHRRE